MSNVPDADAAIDDGPWIRLGELADGSPYHYALDRVENFNVALCGVSGSGKTHLIRLLLSGYHRVGTTSYVVDVHGDLTGAPGIDPAVVHTLAFSYDGTGATINPLRITPHDGPQVIARQFVTAAGLFAPHLGWRQKNTLGRLVEQLFAQWDIHQNDRASWAQPGPVLDDLVQFTREVLRDVRGKRPPRSASKELRKAIEAGIGAHAALQNAGAAHGATDHEGAVTAPDGGGDGGAEADADAAATAEQSYRDAAARLGDLVIQAEVQARNDEGDGGYYDVARLQSVLELLDQMNRCNLFGADGLAPTPRPGVVNRFALEALVERDQQVLSYLLIDRIFNYATRSQSASTLHAVPRYMLFLDEGKIVSMIAQSTMSPLNRTATEGRKFGLGLVLGVQAEHHLTADVKDSCACTILLRQHQRRIDDTARTFRVPAADLEALKPRRDALVQAGTHRYLNLRVSTLG